jgi:glycosyltransferase involved in cell wall biosynthesis
MFFLLHVRIIFLLLIICTHKIFPAASSINVKNSPRILFIDPWKNKMPCGVNKTMISQAKTFYDHGTFLIGLFWQRSYAEHFFKQHHLPYSLIPRRLRRDPDEEQAQGPVTFHEVLKREVKKICIAHAINTVIVLNWQDLPAIKEAAKEVPFNIIFYRIATLQEDALCENIEILKGVDGFVGTSEGVKYVRKANKVYDLAIKKCKEITPFWDEDHCLNFVTNQKRAAYFSQRFNIEIESNSQVICTIANLVHPCKNYPLLLQAMSLLIHDKKCPVHLMIAGKGYLQPSLEELSSEFGIKNYVHFLGSIEDIPALLYHSDMHVLPSYFDCFPLANLEAACMKKPCIVAQGISASSFIHDQMTGLLFKNKDEQDLAEKIVYLLNHPKERIVMGENAYRHAQAHYSNDILYNKWMLMLNELLA